MVQIPQSSGHSAILAVSYNEALARSYANSGLYVFPCGTDKRPLIKEPEKAASRDLGQIARWWRHYRNALIGMPCQPNNIAVLDVDRHQENADGVASLKKFLEHEQLSDRVIVVQSPNDGMHIYFARPPEGLKTTASKIAPGIDTRGDGGYVIAAGSMLPDSRKWVPKWPTGIEELARRIASGDLPEVPSWIIEHTGSSRRSEKNLEALLPSRSSQPKATRYAYEALESACQEVRCAPDGSRNDTLNRAAFAVGQIIPCSSLSETLAQVKLTEAARAAGLDDDEIAKTIASGLSDGQSHPRAITPRGKWDEDAEWPEVGRDGRPKPGYQNAVAAVQKLALVCQHDTFHGRKAISGHPIARYAGEITDDAIAAARALVVETYGFDPGKDHLNDAVNALCIANQFDPVCDWLDKLKWDKQHRLETWLINHAGAADTPLNRAIGMLMLVAMVRRAKQPGCKFDIMIVLEGPQGCGKSSLLLSLAGGPDNFTDAPLLTLDVKGVAEVVGGKWLVEVPELSGLSRRDVEDTKALLSRTDDRARPAYGRHTESHPRRCIFVGTTNADEYLLDDTGNRRFAPVRVGAIDLEGISRERDQLFAEAVHLERHFGTLTLPASLWNAASAEAEQRRVNDPWTETLAEQLHPGRSFPKGSSPPWESLPGGARRVTTAQLATLLGLQPKDGTAGTNRRIASAMRALGWSPDRWRQGDGRKVRGFTAK